MKQIIVLFLALFTSPLYSQDLSSSLKIGPEISTAKFFAEPKFIGSDENSLFFLEFEDGKPYFTKVDANSMEVSLSVLADPNIIDCWQLGSKIVVLTCPPVKKEKNWDVYLHQLNQIDLTLGPAKLVGNGNTFLKSTYSTNPVMKSETMMSQTESTSNLLLIGNYQNPVVVNENQNLMAVLIQKSDAEFTEVIGIDENLNILSPIQLKYPSENFRVHAQMISNDGFLYLYGYNVNYKNPMSTPTIDEHKLVKIDMVKGDIKISESLQIAVENPQDIRMALNSGDNSAIISGFRQDENGHKNSLFIKIYDSNLTELASESIDFSREFILSTYSTGSRAEYDKQLAKGDEIDINLDYYSICEILTNPIDKSITLLAEEKIVYESLNGFPATTTNANASQNSFSAVTTNANILVLRFNSSGELLWKDFVLKFQQGSTEATRYFSFFSFLNGSELNIIFNAPESYLSQKNNLDNVEGNQIGILVKLDETGKQTEVKIYQPDKTNKYIIPKKCHLINNTGIYIPLASSKKMHYSFFPFN